jgi:hypothetical protein
MWPKSTVSISRAGRGALNLQTLRLRLDLERTTPYPQNGTAALGCPPRLCRFVGRAGAEDSVRNNRSD